MPSETKPYMYFWAKADRKDPSKLHRLPYHLLDVGQTALQMWNKAIDANSKRQFCKWLNCDEETARQTLAFLISLHDLGKAMDHNTDGTHAMIGAEFAKRYGVPAKVVNIIASHHHEVEQESVEAIIVEAADAISGARPGARREDLEQYIKRLRALEEIANSFKGVSQSYAIQAGREVRIIVRPEDIDDLAATRLARDIAKKIEETMQYPGQIKVTVIRETRAVDYAR
jgi:ribonuclease Y